MGILLSLLALGSVIILIAYAVKKKKYAKVHIATTLVLAAIISCFALMWYMLPFKMTLPDNPAIYVRDYEHNFQIEDQRIIDDIISLLKKLEYTRELIHFYGVFPAGQLVQADDYFIIEISDADVMIYNAPEHIGNYCFIISKPESSRYIVSGRNNSNKYKILGAADIIGDIYNIVWSQNSGETSAQ